MATARRTETGTVRQEQILAAARKLFKEKGYDGTTIADIVKEAGVAQGTFYLYFSSKRDAFLALSQQLDETAAKTVAGAFDPTLPFKERSRVLAKAGFACGKRNADLVRLVHFGADSMPIGVQTQFLKNNPQIGALTKFFQHAIDAGDIEPIDPEITARLVWGMIKNAFVEAYVLGDEGDVQRLEEGVANLLGGLSVKKSVETDEPMSTTDNGEAVTQSGQHITAEAAARNG